MTRGEDGPPTTIADPAAATPYTDLAAYVAVPRIAGLDLSPDGTRLVTTVATLDPKGTGWLTALWEVDPAGERPARRLTRSAKAEGGPVFTGAGEVLFVSGRPDPATEPDDDAPAALWLLPAAGEARVVGARPGGLGAHEAAGRTVVVLSDTLPASTDGDSDAARRKARKDAKVDAVLHSGYPVRYWDSDLGVGQDRLLVGELPGDECTITWRDLTPEPGRALRGAAPVLSPDGSTVVTSWLVAEPHGSVRQTLVAVDASTGQRRVLDDDGTSDCGGQQVSPDGATVAYVRETRSTPELPPQMHLMLVPTDGSQLARRLAPHWDRWPDTLRWTPDGAALLVTADDVGRAPVFRIDVVTGEVVRLTQDDGHYSDVRPAPDGRCAYALRDAIDTAPVPVRIDVRTPGRPTFLLGPPTAPAPSGRLEEVTATAADGTEVRAWLALPEGDGPHPLLLWVHGGPLSSWNGWSWRWNPWLMAARGWAVLLPDPALSTGYGMDMVRRGWGEWGGRPYTDLLALTDAAERHPSVDPTRTAAMGGSFGGYMANWIAGHTDRFAAIVTHASLWNLEAFGPTTDAAYYWTREMTGAMIRENSPHRFADAIVSPVLVIHGDKDYRVPIGEGLALWWDLVSRAPDPATMPHRFLYFPAENHWVLTPHHARLWYETVLAFLATHVRGQTWQVPELLR